MSKIEISIIVPVYNVSKYVINCLESLEKQDFNEYEVIIVNDGSTDGSGILCEKFIENKERFHLFKKENGGLMSAWMYGVLRAKGKYIGFVDSDDWVDRNMFSVLLSKIKEYDADVVECGYIMEKANGSRIISRNKEWLYENDAVINNYLKEYCYSYLNRECNPTICRWDKIYKKEILVEQFPLMNEKITVGEDFNTNIAVLMKAKKIVQIKKFAPYHYRVVAESMYNSYNSNRFENVFVLSQTLDEVVKKYNLDEKIIGSFIGHMYFEEIKKISARSDFNRLEYKAIRKKILEYKGYKYLDYYQVLRSDLKTNVFIFLFKNNFYFCLKCVRKIYRKAMG